MLEEECHQTCLPPDVHGICENLREPSVPLKNKYSKLGFKRSHSSVMKARENKNKKNDKP